MDSRQIGLAKSLLFQTLQTRGMRLAAAQRADEKAIRAQSGGERRIIERRELHRGAAGAVLLVALEQVYLFPAAVIHADEHAVLVNGPRDRRAIDLEVRLDVGEGTMRWITVGPPDQPDTNIVLTPPAVDPGVTEEERQTIREMMAKGTFALLVLATEDLDAAFERVQSKLDEVSTTGAEIVQEPIVQPYGVRDCGLRDPAGNMVKIQERG